VGLAHRTIAGVVATFVALALLAILAFLFVRRRNANRRAPSSMIDPSLLRSNTSFGGEKLSYHQSGSTSTSMTTPYPPIPSTMGMPPMKLYVRYTLIPHPPKVGIAEMLRI